MMKISITLLLLQTILCGVVYGQCSDLFFSEYVEGSGNNNAVEIYNPTNATIDLSGYVVSRYVGGSGTASETLTLSGFLASGDVVVVMNGQTDSLWIDPPGYWSLPTDLIFQSYGDIFDGSYPAVTYFNGDDAITLETTTGGIVDIIGKVGEDPGAAWTDDATAGYTDANGGTWWTKRQTLVRKSSVQGGVTMNPTEFNATLEWDSLPDDTWDSLGVHTCNCLTIPSSPLIDCSLLEVTDIVVDNTNLTIDISIFNGDTNQINYPYIGLVVDAIGDTIQNGTASFFVQFPLDTMTYSYTLNSASPVYPLTIYFAYSDLIGGMGTDTCILTYTAPPDFCDSMNVTFIELDTTGNPNLIDFEIETFYTTSHWFGYCGFILFNDMGDTVAYENINTAANVFGIGPTTTEIRILDVTQNLTLPFSGTLHLIEGLFAGNPGPQCSFPFNISAGTTSIEEFPTPNKQVLTITDLLGRTTYPTPNALIFYLYDDGSVEKRIQLER